MKRVLISLAAALLLALGLSCAGAETKIMVVSDVHYLSHTLYEVDNPYFAEVVEKGVGKATQYSSELLDGLLAEAYHQQPDLLLITGDLTFNGEAVSHQELADAMRALQAEGIRVAVIPGNHDINNENAVRFTDTGIEWVDNVNSADFAEIWQGMTADELTGPGFSGVVKLNDRVWVVLGDYSVYEDRIETHGVATDEHVQWMTDVMSAAKEAGVTVVSASHQTLVKHTEYTSHTFRVINGEKITAILEQNGCRLNLCGHMHNQNILPGEALTDVATEAWCISPHRYGVVIVADDGTLTYDAYAACAEHLPENLAETTRELFRQTMYKGERVELMMMGVFDQQLTDMATFAINVSEYYFEGTTFLHPEVLTDPAAALWKQYERSSSFARYIMTILTEDIVDCLHWSSAD